MPLRCRDVPRRIADRHIGMRDSPFRADRRRAQMQLVIGDTRAGVVQLVPEEEPEMRAPRDQIALAPDAPADRAVREVGGQRDTALPLFGEALPLLLAPVAARQVSPLPAAQRNNDPTDGWRRAVAIFDV